MEPEPLTYPRCICWIAGYCGWWNPPEEMRLIKNDFCIECWKFKKKM